MKHLTAARARPIRANAHGFTLIELMITLAIVAILAAIAYPSYASYVVRSNRAAAAGVLLELSTLQQRYLLDNRAYATSVSQLMGASWTPPANVSPNYDIAIPAPAAGSGPVFSITATPKSGQATRDTNCAMLTIDQTGAKFASGTLGAAGCW